MKESEVKKAEAKEDEEKAAEITDISDALLALISSVPNGTVEELKAKITEMFQNSKDEKVKTLTLTSGHKAKGREWDRVFWYGRNKWNPSPFAKKPWQFQQEMNLCYVMATRARFALYDVSVAG